MSPAEESGVATIVAAGAVMVAPGLITYVGQGLTMPAWLGILNFLLAWTVGSRVGAHIYAERMKEGQ